jgi:pyridoxine 4-dehydrogenase
VSSGRREIVTKRSGCAPNVLLIPGTRTRKHLAENLQVAAIELDGATRLELARHFPAVR